MVDVARDCEDKKLLALSLKNSCATLIKLFSQHRISL